MNNKPYINILIKNTMFQTLYKMDNPTNRLTLYKKYIKMLVI